MLFLEIGMFTIMKEIIGIAKLIKSVGDLQFRIPRNIQIICNDKFEVNINLVVLEPLPVQCKAKNTVNTSVITAQR